MVKEGLLAERSDGSSGPGDGETLDYMLGESFRFIQAGRGYRFAVDSLLLAGFSRIRPGEVGLDLGTGCGVVACLAASLQPDCRIVALELQPDLADRACRNAELNGLGERVRVVRGDLRRADLFLPGCFDFILTNPPYRPVGAGRLNPSSEKAAARHELTATLDDWTVAAQRWLKPAGRLFLVYPAWRLARLVARLEELSLTPKRLRLVHSRPGGEAVLVLLEAVKGGGEELAVGPPLFIYSGETGPDWSAEMKALGDGPLLGEV